MSPLETAKCTLASLEPLSPTFASLHGIRRHPQLKQDSMALAGSTMLACLVLDLKTWNVCRIYVLSNKTRRHMRCQLSFRAMTCHGRYKVVRKSSKRAVLASGQIVVDATSRDAREAKDRARKWCSTEDDFVTALLDFW